MNPPVLSQYYYYWYRLKQSKMFAYALAGLVQVLVFVDEFVRLSTHHQSRLPFVMDIFTLCTIEFVFLLIFHRVFDVLLRRQPYLPRFLATQLAMLGAMTCLLPSDWLHQGVALVVIHTCAYMNVLTMGIAPALAIVLMSTALFWLVGHMPALHSMVCAETAMVALLAFGRPSQVRSRSAFWNPALAVTSVLFIQYVLTTGNLQTDWHVWLITLGTYSIWSLLSIAFALVLLPFIEQVFGYLTPFRLLELANMDHPLLKQLQVDAPGTFHHSLVLASLSEAAADTIGANGLLARVGCLYHDIGKMKRPTYFVENQSYYGMNNPHDELSPRLSKAVVVAHPRDGQQMADEHRLPEGIKAFMPEHHGTLLCGYFYFKAVKEEGKANVCETEFRYPGPKPQSRETAIVMMADACESAVRALKNPTPVEIEALVGKLFQQRVDDGQLDECPLTLAELNTIKQTFIKMLFAINHQRVNYSEKIKAIRPSN
ncbi:MAG: HDIG domain-containing metalloprotein [Vampirovibrionales bacterium]